MASRGTKLSTLFAVCLVMTMEYGGAMAQLGCSTALIGLAPCLSFISGSASTPGNSCCTQLQNVVKTQASCLCQVLNGGGSSNTFGVTINQTQALQLPGACKVDTPPVSQCNAANQPAGASPADSPTSSPADATTPEASVTPDAPAVSSIPSSGGASKSSTSSTSAANMIKLPMQLTLLLLFITSAASAIITT